MEEDRDGWFFHVTYYWMLEGIADNGLIGGTGQSMGTTHVAHSRGRIFFSTKDGATHWYWVAELHADNVSDNHLETGMTPVMLRFPKDILKKKDILVDDQARASEYAYYTTKTIKPKHLEVWNGSGWAPVNEWEDIDPESAYDVDSDEDDDTGEANEFHVLKPDNRNPLLPKEDDLEAE